MNQVDADRPDGWEVQPLGAVATTQLGKTINPKEKNGPRQKPYLRNANVQWGEFDLTDVATMHFSGEESNKYRLEAGDLLICEGGVVGRGAIWSGTVADCHFQNALHRIRPRDRAVTTEWLLENMRYLAGSGFLAKRARGNTIQHLSQQELRLLPILIPPRTIQDRLVETLNLSRAATVGARAHISTAQRAVERFRQSVLAAACSGRLTADWRDVHASGDRAEDEIERNGLEPQKLRRGVDPATPPLEYPDLPEAWTTMTVAQLLSRGVLVDVKDGNHGANHPKVSEFSTDGLPFITANLVRDGVIDYDSAPKVAGSVLDRLRVGFSQPGDVVLTHKGTVGRVAVASRDSVLTPQTTYYRCERALLDPRYLAHFMASLHFYEQLAKVMSQTTRDFVPIVQQYKLSVILPPMDEQREIVRRVDQLLKLVNDIERRVDSAARKVERSSQAVLAKAFRGELAGSSVAASP